MRRIQKTAGLAIVFGAGLLVGRYGQSPEADESKRERGHPQEQDDRPLVVLPDLRDALLPGGL